MVSRGMSRPCYQILFIILDGAADVGKRTPLEAASTPNLDLIAKHSYCGLWTGPSAGRGYNIKSMSEIATLELLGYASDESPGRGVLEALGIGIKPKKGAIYLRANFATVDRGWKIIDRRAGRDETGLDELSKAVSMKIGGIKLAFHRSLGHRGVLELTGRGLSPEVGDSDVGGVKPAVVHARSKAGAKTAYVLNEFLKRSNEALSGHPANRKRKLPANFILLRGAGRMRRVEPFSRRFGLKGCAVAADGLVKGVARYIGLDVLEVKGATGDANTDLKAKLGAAMRGLETHDFVMLHIKGADVCSHSRDRAGKAAFIERLDRELFEHLIKHRNVNVAVTCDHITDSRTGEHRFGPVPYLVYLAGDGSNNVPRFTEAACSRGFQTANPMEKFMLTCCAPAYHRVA